MKIEAIYAWIGVYADGSESILYGDLPVRGPRGTPHMVPLIACQRATAEALIEVARRVQAQSHGEQRPRRVVLRTFAASVVSDPVIGIAYADPQRE